MAVLILCGILLLCALSSFVDATYPIDVRCGSSSNFKWLNLVQPQGISNCAYTIKPYNYAVCQLRVEFTTNLPDPTISFMSSVPLCSRSNSIYIGKFIFCGKNNHQHVYIDLDGSNLSNDFTITTYVTSGTYSIQVRQIVCPAVVKRDQNEIGGWQSPFATWLANSRMRSHLSDRYLVAPTGCDQYYIPLSGFVESFGWNFGRGPYPGDLKYNVCFKTLQRSSRLRLTGLDFSLGGDGGKYLNDYCFDPERDPGDYIQLHSTGRIVETQETAQYFCGNVLEGKTVESNIFGTAMFTFNAGDDSGVIIPKRVFKFKYEVR